MEILRSNEICIENSHEMFYFVLLYKPGKYIDSWRKMFNFLSFYGQLSLGFSHSVFVFLWEFAWLSFLFHGTLAYVAFTSVFMLLIVSHSLSQCFFVYFHSNKSQIGVYDECFHGLYRGLVWVIKSTEKCDEWSDIVALNCAELRRTGWILHNLFFPLISVYCLYQFSFLCLPLSALNAQAALSQVRERQLAAHSPTPSAAPEVNGGASSSSVTVPRPEHCEGAAAGGRITLPPPAVPPPVTPASTPVLAPARPPVSPQTSAVQHMLQEAEEALLTKLRWATTQLQSSASVETSIQLCSLITSCASSLRSLKELSQ